MQEQRVGHPVDAVFLAGTYLMALLNVFDGFVVCLVFNSFGSALAPRALALKYVGTVCSILVAAIRLLAL